jgi:bacteriocin biosynthesis cyclodehydratase domain-containing protein
VDAVPAANPSLPELTLGPATRLLWRSPDSVQLQLGGALDGEGVIVDGLPAPVLARIASPVPPQQPAPPVAEPVRAALTALADAGFLWPRGSGADPDPRLAPPHPRLAGQLTSLAPRHRDAAAQVLAARRYAAVQVTGRSRLVPHLAAVLAAAGVGNVHCAVDGPARLHHVQPGGVTTADEGAPLAVAAEAAVRRAAPDADTRPPDAGRPDLTIVAVESPIPDERLDALHAAGAPYLAVRLGVDCGVVGPLVLPGRSSCLRCAELHRGDRDPAWSALAVQLALDGRHGPAADVAVATIVAGVAAQQALAFVDGEATATLDGTLELRLPDWRLRRRSWSVHPGCSCTGELDRP